MRRTLILHTPVIHKGYLDFLNKFAGSVEKVYLVPESMVEGLSTIKPDIASLPAKEVARLLKSMGYGEVEVFLKTKAAALAKKPLLFVDDRVSRALRDKYFAKSNVRMSPVFLRWDVDSVFREESLTVAKTKAPFDRRMMGEARKEAQKSSDWWRQVGAVLVKGKKVLSKAFNEAMPSDHTPYQLGAVRDFLKPGEKPEMVDVIHAEQKIIANAAKNGLSLRGTALYVTHFPCPVCAKLIASSGIARCYFAEGSSSLAGGRLLERAGVKLMRVV
ncbi:MAG: deaminase [Patescibacteria group bacterium]